MTSSLKPPVIFLAFASAWDLGELQELPVEAKALRGLLEPLQVSRQITLVIRQDVTVDEIVGVFQDARYHGNIAVFHYAGHADQYALLLSERGRLQKANASGLAAFLAEQPGLRLVFLNGCSTQAQTAELLQAGVETVIATELDVPDNIAREFAERFYRGLAGGSSIASAYKQAGSIHGMLEEGRSDDWTLALHPDKPDAGKWTIPAPLPDRADIQVALQGPVTLIAGTQEIAQLAAAIEKLDAARFVLSAAGAGARIDLSAGAPPRLAPRPRPVFAPPDFVPELIGREQESATLAAALQANRAIEVYGPADVGKTALLESLAAHAVRDAFPDGIVFLRPFFCVAATDLLQLIHDQFYTYDSAEVKLADTQIMRDLQSICALIVLDNDGLPKDALEVLLAALSNSRLLLSSRQQGGRHPGRIRPMALRELPLPAARALYKAAIERPLMPSEEAALDALIAALGAKPGEIVRAAAIAREDSGQGAYAAAPTAGAGYSQAGDILARLSAEQQRLVAALAAIHDASLGQEALLRIAGVSSPTPALDALVQMQVVRTHSPRYSLVDSFAPLVLASINTAEWRDKIQAYFDTWLRQPSLGPQSVIEEMPAILVLLRQLASRGQNWRGVLQMTRALEPALIAGRQWGAWRIVLEMQLEAARALNDASAEGWALHQLGTRALCLGEAAEARERLEEALRVRTQVGVRAAIDLTRHNLNLLPPPAGAPPKQDPPHNPPAQPPPRPRPSAAAPVNPNYRLQPQGGGLGHGNLPAGGSISPQQPIAGSRRGGGCIWGILLGIAAFGLAVWLWWGQLPGQRTVAPSSGTSNPKATPTRVIPTRAREVPKAVPPTATRQARRNPTNTPQPAAKPAVVQPPDTATFTPLPAPTDTPTFTPVPAIIEPDRPELPPNEIPTNEPPVAPIPQILDFRPDPAAVVAGDPVSLCFQTVDASYVLIESESDKSTDFKLNPTKDCVTVYPYETRTQYTLHVFNENGEEGKPWTVEVLVGPG